MGVVNGPMVAITSPVGGFPWTLAIVLLIVFVIAIGLAAREVLRRRQKSPPLISSSASTLYRT